MKSVSHGPWLPSVILLLTGIGSAVLCRFLVRCYGFIHWHVISDASGHTRELAWELLREISGYRFGLALVAILCAVTLAFRRPRWVALLAVPAALYAVDMAIVLI